MPLSDKENKDHQSLLARQQYFINIINNVPGAVLRFELFPDDSHRFVYLSEQSEKLFGVKSEDALKDSQILWDQIVKEDALEFKRSLIQSAKNNSTWNYEWRVVTQNKQLKWLKGTGTPVKLENSWVWDTLILDITEQKIKEKELAKKTAILERTESLAKIGSWDYNPITGEIYWSEEVFKIFNFDSSKPTPSLEDQMKLLSKTSKKELMERSRIAFEEKKSFDCELKLTGYGNKLTYCLIKGFYQFDENGKLIQVYGSLQDISERKQIEKELQESEAMFKNIADNIPGLVIRYVEKEDNDQVVFISKGFELLFEKESQNDPLRVLREQIHPDDLNHYKTSQKRSSEDLTIWDKELRLLMPDGRIKWIQGKGQPQRAKNNQLIWDIMLLDITAQRNATDSVRSLKNQLDLAIQTADLGVWKVDFQSNDVYWNDEVLRIYGISRDEFNHNKDAWKKLVHPEDWPAVKQAALDASKGKNAIRSGFRVIQPSGELKYVIASASPYYQDNLIIGVIGINLDITHFKEIEKDLLHAKLLAEKNEQEAIFKNKELEKANQELDNFVYRVSHDLRSPITSAIGLSEISLRSNDIEEIHQFDQLRIQTLEKLDSFIKEILNYSRNSRMPIKAEKIIFKDLINKILLEHAGTIQKNNITVNINIKEDRSFKCDKMRISTIFDNLLSNALKFFNPYIESPRVNIKIKADNKEASIEISDNGMGIKKDRQDKIFNMFYRGTDKKNGSGIGLYILKECLNKVDGNIKLVSEEGNGSTFNLSIPNAKA